MRIVSGKYRGAVLYEFKGRDVRPTADRTKESVFNILSSLVPGSCCLDLFCGTGSLGIEALSRGAKEVVFVDKARESVELTKRNLAKVRETANVFNLDALSYLKTAKGTFDIIFIDPPYADDVSQKAVELIFEKQLLSYDGIIVFERDIPFNCSVSGAAVYDQRKYGKAIVSFIRKEKKCLFAGSFDPFTKGHYGVLNYALKNYDKVFVCIMDNADKTPYFSLSDRIEIVKKSVGSSDKIIVDYWDGLLVDYMNDKEITVNLRGIRNEVDLAYEKNMEEYNKNLFSEIKYDYFLSEYPVSSTEVRNRLINKQDISDLIVKSAYEYVVSIK